ncbi:MAG: hypothetical protein HC841_05885 [Verrucomicrobiae bacterium]|nr:hypothetical protein [Verrucomicrobiae bacterium]
MTAPFDNKAVRILFSTYWSPKGWKPKPETSPDDFAYAKDKGLMFEPMTKSHDAIISELVSLADQIDPVNVGDAFLFSLGSRQLAYRSALGSYAMSRWMPRHKFSQRPPANSAICADCGDFRRFEAEDMNILNFERLKWGGVRHGSPYYALFDLSELLKLPVAVPTEADKTIFRNILATAVSLPSKARPRDLERAIATCLQSTKHERSKLVQLLGYCGILQPKNRPGFYQEFTPYNQREDRPVHKIDWRYPVSWWQGEDSVNWDAVRFYFPTVELGPLV